MNKQFIHIYDGKVQCCCGLIMSKKSITKHLKTIYHQKCLANGLDGRKPKKRRGRSDCHQRKSIDPKLKIEYGPFWLHEICEIK
jgi:hypothetical protein